MDDLVSDRLGEEENPQGLDFYLQDDGTYAVGVGNAKCLSSIVIPETYKSKAITAIIDEGFKNCTKLKQMVIPDSVESIGDDAFHNCSSLSSVTIGNSVTNIVYYAFSDCSSLSKVYYKGTAVEWNNISIDNYGNDCLTNATRYYYSEEYPESFEENKYWHYVDNEPTIWEDILYYTLINNNMEYEVTGIRTLTDTDIVIPNTYNNLPVTSIRIFVFSHCDSLTSVTIGNSVNNSWGIY